MKPDVAMAVLQHAMDLDEGWCTYCQDFTTGECEPDARLHTCAACGADSVYGAEEASVMGLFTIDGEEVG